MIGDKGNGSSGTLEGALDRVKRRGRGHERRGGWQSSVAMLSFGCHAFGRLERTDCRGKLSCEATMAHACELVRYGNKRDLREPFS